MGDQNAGKEDCGGKKRKKNFFFLYKTELCLSSTLNRWMCIGTPKPAVAVYLQCEI